SNLANENRITAATVESYLEILSQTYVNFVLHSFSGNFANELKKSKKYYLYDLGIRNALLK
ncbi:MAG TPA: ATPase, partial [Deltaproteobacteria bacterium]|nr:ATPase [Deltaproteobacteria bacterium]